MSSCLWCLNPEGLSSRPEVMVAASCRQCGKCRLEDCEASRTGRCIACGKCIVKCPDNFRKIIGKEYTPEELAETILKNRMFLSGSAGGVTFSGGEPLMQHEFLHATCDLLPLHKTLQTSGFCPPEIFAEAIRCFDYVLFDSKHSDRTKHRTLTGQDNAIILENLRLLKTTGIPFVLRVPIIKGINDGMDHFSAIAELVKDAPNLVRVELLPYNTVAPAKYPLVGRIFKHHFFAPDTVDTSPFEEAGIQFSIL